MQELENSIKKSWKEPVFQYDLVENKRDTNLDKRLAKSNKDCENIMDKIHR